MGTIKTGIYRHYTQNGKRGTELANTIDLSPTPTPEDLLQALKDAERITKLAELKHIVIVPKGEVITIYAWYDPNIPLWDFKAI